MLHAGSSPGDSLSIHGDLLVVRRVGTTNREPQASVGTPRPVVHDGRLQRRLAVARIEHRNAPSTEMTILLAGACTLVAMTRATVFAACLVMAAVSCRSNDDKRPRPEMSTLPPGPAKPDQPAAAQFAAWLAAFNTADRTQLVAYHDKLFPYAVASNDIGDIERELGLARSTGGFDLRKAEQSTATRFTALMQEKESDQFARATMDVDAAAPHRVTKFHIGPVPTPDEFHARRTSEAEALKALRAELDHVVARDRFSGAVLVARNGEPIFAEAYGMADREHKVPNKLDTKFRIGSMNKMFTATATIQLVQAGKLAVADTLGKIVHDYPNTTLASKVTLHHMLTHTGGTGDIFGPEFDKHRLELRTLQDYVNLYGKRDLAYEPGSKWAYSNYGFVLLGVVIERATGQELLRPGGRARLQASGHDRDRVAAGRPGGARSLDRLHA